MRRAPATRGFAGAAERGPGYGIEWLDADPSRAPTFEAAYQDPSIDAQFDEVMARVAPDA
jgi:hypothetical protein